MKIGNVNIRGNIFLAPLAGVSDLPFRLIARENGADLTYTEMVSSKAITYKNENTFKLLKTYEGEGPIALQLFGCEPKVIAESIRMVEEYPFDIIDFNMGCPVPKVVNNKEGSFLMTNPKLVYDIVSSAAKATKKPFTVKIRKGFNITNAVEVAKAVEEGGGSAVAVHGRLRSEYYRGKADWNIISEVKKAVNIPVIGNGDITSPIEAKRIFDETSCDAIMIGRAAQGNPFIFKQIKDYLNTGNYEEKIGHNKLRNIIIKHARLLIEYKGDYTGIREMRKHLAWYTAGMPNAARLRRDACNIQDIDAIEEILDRMLG